MRLSTCASLFSEIPTSLHGTRPGTGWAIPASVALEQFGGAMLAPNADLATVVELVRWNPDGNPDAIPPRRVGRPKFATSLPRQTLVGSATRRKERELACSVSPPALPSSYDKAATSWYGG